MPETEQRKLAVIMLTDMVGYSALTDTDEGAALNILEDEARLGLIDGDMVAIFIESRIYEQVWTVPQFARQVI